MVLTDLPFSEARILVVDDEPANVLVLERFLSRWGYENVVSTTESSQVVALVEAQRPSLVLLDLIMPQPDGFEVMRLLSEQHTGPEAVPVLVLTADVSAATKEQALTHGASGESRHTDSAMTVSSAWRRSRRSAASLPVDQSICCDLRTGTRPPRWGADHKSAWDNAKR